MHKNGTQEAYAGEYEVVEADGGRETESSGEHERSASQLRAREAARAAIGSGRHGIDALAQRIPLAPEQKACQRAQHHQLYSIHPVRGEFEWMPNQFALKTIKYNMEKLTITGRNADKCRKCEERAP